MTWPLPQSQPAERFAILCFGYEADRLRRQPWHIARGLAEGLARLGHAATVLTDAVRPPVTVDYGTERLDQLLDRGRVAPALRERLRELRPARIFIISGARELARLQRLDLGAPVSLVIASPRINLRELARAGLPLLWRERRLLALPVLNALLPGRWLRHGFERSGADELIYLSRATRARYTKFGLPAGRLLVPQVEAGVCVGLPAPPAGVTRIVYFGPALGLRGADLAIHAFEQAVERGLHARLDLLMRPDGEDDGLGRILAKVVASPARSRITVVTRLLTPGELRAHLAKAHVFLLPFLVPVSEVPLVVIEAGLSGRPVVVLDAPGITEYAEALGGVVASAPVALPGALIEACAKPAQSPPDPTRWTRWDHVVAPFAQPRRQSLDRYRLIAICGVDGSGKTMLVERLRAEMIANGITTRHVWSRFRNYSSKPLLALARLTGHNHKEHADGVRVGYHDFAGTLYAKPFLALQALDNLADMAFRFGLRGRGPLVADRCVLDTLVDLAIDTGLDELVLEKLGPKLIRRLPSPAAAVVIVRSPALIRAQRPDALADRHFARRRVLYLRLARQLGLPVIENDGPPQATLAGIIDALETARADLRCAI